MKKREVERFEKAIAKEQGIVDVQRKILDAIRGLSRKKAIRVIRCAAILHGIDL